jgi:hypothetical protein
MTLPRNWCAWQRFTVYELTFLQDNIFIRCLESGSRAPFVPARFKGAVDAQRAIDRQNVHRISLRNCLSFLAAEQYARGQRSHGRRRSGCPPLHQDRYRLDRLCAVGPTQPSQFHRSNLERRTAGILILPHKKGDESHEDYHERNSDGTRHIFWLRVCRGWCRRCRWRRGRRSGWRRRRRLGWCRGRRSFARCDCAPCA